MEKYEDEDFLDDDEDSEEDELTGWEILEEKYGRELTPDEVRRELTIEYELEHLDLKEYAKEFEEDLLKYNDWLILKEDIRQSNIRRENLKPDPARSEAAIQQAAEDVYFALCSPPLDDSDDDLSDEQFEEWVNNVNSAIKEKLDFYSLIRLESIIRKNALRHSASLKAGKRHEENRAMKAEIFDWLDQNAANFKSLDSTAEAIAGKVAPIAFRTARNWVGEHKKLRSAGTD